MKMKKILFGLCLLISFGLKAQIYTPEGARSFTFGKFDSSLAIPVRDTGGAFLSGREVKRPGLLRVRPQDSLVYRYTGKKWTLLVLDSTGLTALVNKKVDSVKILTDTLFYYINGVAHGSVFSVSSAYPTALAFDSTTGILTLSRNGISDLTQNLDGRYSLKDHTHVFANITDGTVAVHNLFSGGTNISYNPATGVIAASGLGALSPPNIAGYLLNGFGAFVRQNTDSILEGSINLFFTNPHWDTRFAATVPVSADATTNKYYYWNNGSIGRHQIPYTDLGGTPDLSVYELLSNKSTDLISPNNTKYPTTLAVSNALALKLNISDSSAMLANYKSKIEQHSDSLTKVVKLRDSTDVYYPYVTNPKGYLVSSDLSGYVPTSRTLTINGTAFDLSANRAWSVGTVTSVAKGYGLLTDGTITTTGTNTVDSATLALTFKRNKDSVNNDGYATVYSRNKARDSVVSLLTSWNLQKVTDAGASTTNTVTVNSLVWNGGTSSSLGTLTKYGWFGDWTGSVLLGSTFNSNTGDLTLGNGGLSAGRKWELPDASGTIALTSDIHSETDPLSIHLTGLNTLTGNDTIVNSGNHLVITNNNSNRTIDVQNSSSGIAVYGQNSGAGVGVYGNTATGSGVFGNSSSSGYGVEGQSVSGYGVHSRVEPTSTNTIVGTLLLDRYTSGSGANGIGQSIDFENETTSSVAIANQLISKWTDATHATRTSQFDITGVNSATTETFANFQTGGIIRTNNNADTLSTKAYARSVGGSGGGTWGSITGTLSAQTDLQSALDAKQTTTLADGKVLVGNASNVATAVTPSGDVTITNAGVTAIGASKVTNSMLAGSIAYSKLSLTGAILNADLAGSIDAAKINTGAVSNTEFNYLDGVTSAIQTQLDSKISGNQTITLSGDVIGSGTTSITATLARQLAPTAVKTTTYTAAANDFVPCDNTSGSFTVTLPTAPADKTIIGVKMVVQSGSNTITIAAGGSDVFNKASGSTTLSLPLLNQAFILQYKSSTGIWYVLSTDAPLSQLDSRYLQTANNLSDVTASTARTNLGAAPTASPTFTGTVTIPTSFVLGATTVTTTGTQLNYLNAATGTTGTTSTNLVYSTSPTLVTPILGTPTSVTLNNTSDVIGGVAMTLGSDANYDIYYRNSSGVLTRLAANTDGKVLTTHSTTSPPTWETASGGTATTTTDNQFLISSNVLTAQKSYGTLTDGATITWDASGGYDKKVTLGGNRTLSITNGQNGDYGTLIVTQDGTGGRTLSVPNGTVTLNSGASQETILTYTYDGTIYRWNVTATQAGVNADATHTGWLTSTDWSTFNNKASASQTMYIGTTSHAINRASASEALTGITSIDGSAATLTTPRAIYGNNFDGSGALTQIIASTYGGTGNGFTKFSGAASTEKTFTLPNASATILTDNAAVTVAQGGTGAGTHTAHDALIGNGTSAFTELAPGTSGNLMVSNGTDWTSTSIGASVSAVITGSNSTETGQTLNNITGLSVALLANATYIFTARITANSSSSAGMKFAVQYSTSGATVECQINGTSSGATATKAERINAFNTAPATAYMQVSGDGAEIITGTITVGANAGNLTIQMLKVTSGTATVYTGSSLTAVRIL